MRPFLITQAGRGLNKCRARSITEETHDALIFFDVPAVLVVVSRDRQWTSISAFHFPDTGTGHRTACGLHSRSAQLIEVDLHSRQDTVELRDVPGSAVVRGDRED